MVSMTRKYINQFARFFLICFLAGSTVLPAYADYAGQCCEGHGGAGKCNLNIGYIVCSDGYESSCKCD